MLTPFGEVAEWLKAPLSKSGDGATRPRVQIPPSPLRKNLCKANALQGYFSSVRRDLKRGADEVGIEA